MTELSHVMQPQRVTRSVISNEINQTHGINVPKSKYHVISGMNDLVVPYRGVGQATQKSQVALPVISLPCYNSGQVASGHRRGKRGRGVQ